MDRYTHIREHLRSLAFHVNLRMNFAAQFFANFVNDGLQPQEARRGFNDSEEYDPFWQRWETVACKSETLRVSPTPNNSQCPLESERCDSSETDVDESRYHVATPSHPAVPPSKELHSPAPARKTPKQRCLPEPPAAPAPVLHTGESKRVDDPQPASKAPVEPAEPSSSVALPAFPQLTENATFLSLFQALVYVLLRLFLSFILLFLPRYTSERS